MGETPVYHRARVRTRYPAQVTRLPWLARPLAGAGFSKPRGLRRLTHKLAKALFFGIHGRLGLPARGEMEVLAPRRGCAGSPSTAPTRPS